MRKPADSMTNSADDRILEYLSDVRSETEKGKSPGEIATVTDYHPKHIGRRCKSLADLGLIINLGRSAYRLTDLGHQYLSGELDASTLEASDETPESDN